MSDLVRLSVNMNQETADAFYSIAARKGVSYTEALRRCVALAAFIYGAESDGDTIQAVGPSGTRELHTL
jgi:hypothetical protein